MTAPFRLRAPKPIEIDIHESCARVLDALLMPPAQWAFYPAGAIQLQPHQAAKLARMGLKRAWPDFMILYRALYGIELKDHDGALSKTRIVRTKRGAPRILIGQEENFPLLLASGGFKAIEVVRSLDELLAQLDRWGIPLRGRARAA